MEDFPDKIGWKNVRFAHEEIWSKFRERIDLENKMWKYLFILREGNIV